MRRRHPTRITRGGSQGVQPTLQHDEQDRGARQQTRSCRCASSPSERGRPCCRQRTQERGCSVAEMDDRLGVGAFCAPRAARPGGAGNAPVALVDAPKIRRIRAVAAPIVVTMANGRSADTSGARPSSASHCGVPRAAAITARVKRASARKSIAAARSAIAIPAGAPQRAAKPPITPWIRIAPRPAAANRRPLSRRPVS